FLCGGIYLKLNTDLIKKIVAIILIFFACILSVISISFGILRNQLFVMLPKIEDITENPQISSQIFDRNDNFVASVQLDEYRISVPLSEIPKHVRNAIIASEDERFYEHGGADIIGIIRAAIRNVFHLGIVEGGSTISQQLARALFLSTEQTFTRKIKEVILANELENRYTKDEILEYYLNYVYFGPSPAGRCYGVEAAARNFFGKKISEVSVSEAALIAGTLPAPSLYSPWINKEIAIENRNVVLHKMLRNKFITEEEYQNALKEEINLKTLMGTQFTDSKYYFVDYVKQKVLEMFPEDVLLKEGLKIYTTLDLDIQDKASASLNETFKNAEKSGYFKKDLKDKIGVIQPQGQILAMDPKSGEILALVGGRDYSNTQFNRCTSPRQPGSLFKIFDYTTAIENGVVGTGTIITSEELSMQDQEKMWKPEEWIGENQYFGPLTVREALVKSSNICAVKVAQRCGWDRVAYYAEKMGINSKILPVPSMSIGSLEVTPIEMATAFSVLANNGEKAEPICIKKITTKDDKLLYEHHLNRTKVIKKETAILMNDLFRSVAANVIGYMPFEVAGKTGTSEDFLSGWFVGYTPEIVVCSWVGRDSREVPLPGAKLWGSSFAAPMVKNCLLKIQYTLSKEKFLKNSENIITTGICRDSGLLAIPDCPSNRVVSSSYIAGSEPTLYCPIHREEFVYRKICKESGLLANEWCTETEEKAFLKGTEPTIYCNIHKPPLSIYFSPSECKVNEEITLRFDIFNDLGNVVELYIDNKRVASITEPPYEYKWIFDNDGQHNIMAVLRKDEQYVYMLKTDVRVHK
ncbi:MAG: PBP1A family penicillin-binding protein, partial [Caldisericia bacterium]|nr:PBP1A family penicillin-binding protein [Caldisericia bacterium]